MLMLRLVLLHPLRLSSLLLGLSCAVGCYTKAPLYVAPTSGALASVTFDSKSKTGMPSSSEDYLNFSLHTCLGPGGDHLVEVPPKEKKTVQVRAGEPLRVSLTTAARGGSGTVYFSFVPDPAGEYRAVYTEMPGPPGPDSMKIVVLDAASKKVPFECGQKSWPRCGE